MNALMLPGQAAAPDGPVDMSGMYVMHHAFRRDLADFAGAASMTPLDAGTTWTRLDRRWHRVSEELHTHHSKEDDILWPLLEERAIAAGDIKALTVLADMEAEHATIDPVLERCTAAFATMAKQASDAGRSELGQAISAARDSLGQHLDHEERSAVAIAQRHLGAEEWAVIERERFRGKPSPAVAAFMIPWMAKGLPSDVVTRMRKQSGLVFSLLLRANRGRFMAAETATFLYAAQKPDERR